MRVATTKDSSPRVRQRWTCVSQRVFTRWELSICLNSAYVLSYDLPKSGHRLCHSLLSKLNNVHVTLSQSAFRPVWQRYQSLPIPIQECRRSNCLQVHLPFLHVSNIRPSMPIELELSPSSPPLAGENKIQVLRRRRSSRVYAFLGSLQSAQSTVWRYEPCQ
jgi:hypothetical protein